MGRPRLPAADIRLRSGRHPEIRAQDLGARCHVMSGVRARSAQSLPLAFAPSHLCLRPSRHEHSFSYAYPRSIRISVVICVRDIRELRRAVRPSIRRGSCPRIVALHGLGLRVVVTTAYIPTVGEYAGRALASFETLQNTVDLSHMQRSATAREAAAEFVRACLALMRKFPAQARLNFASVLPFTQLELELMGHGHLDDASVADAIALRLLEWARRSPIFVNEANVHAADFLAQLTPHLDLWSQRQSGGHRGGAASSRLAGTPGCRARARRL